MKTVKHLGDKVNRILCHDKNQNGSKLKFIFVHSTKGKKLVQFQFFISSYHYQTVSAAVVLACIGSCLSLCLIQFLSLMLSSCMTSLSTDFSWFPH